MKNSRDKFLSKEIFCKGYYDAPITDLSGFVYGKDICQSCNEEKSRFIIPPFQEYGKCCLDCLLVNDIRFSHQSERGIVDMRAPRMEGFGHISDCVTQSQVLEMDKTPEFQSYQGGVWLLHCNDFMIFKGIWEPVDFTRNTKSTGKGLFLEMTGKDESHLWESLELDDNETEFTWEDVNYYVFECKHCGKRRGNWDCD